MALFWTVKFFPAIMYTVFRPDRLHNGRDGSGVLLATGDNVNAIIREDLLSESDYVS